MFKIPELSPNSIGHSIMIISYKNFDGDDHIRTGFSEKVYFNKLKTPDQLIN